MNIAEVIAKEIRVDKVLFMLRSMKFTWCQNPITILRSELQILGLDWTVFEEDPILFCTLKQKLYGMFCGKFRKYQPLLHLINQRQWRGQVNMIWENLFDGSIQGDSYARIETLINLP